MVKRKMKRLLLSLLSGFLLISIFPKFNLEILAWVSLVPLFLAIRNTSPIESLKLGFISGLVFFLGVLYWVVNAMTVYGGMPLPSSLAVLILLSGYLSIYLSLFTFLLSYISGDTPQLKYILAPFLWVALELIRAHLLTGFPWATLGYSQFNILPLIQIADITGVYGVSFAIVMSNAAIALFIECLPPFSPSLIKGGSGGVSKFAIQYMLFTAILITSFSIYGFWRISDFNSNDPSTGWVPRNPKSKIKVALIQGNIEQSEKWDEAHQTEIFKIHEDLTLQAANEKPDLIVWSESATPFSFQFDKNYRQRMIELAKKGGSFLLFGTPGYEISGGEIIPYNRAYLLSPQGDVMNKYDKIHLVPFGEYVPLRKILFFIDKMVVGIGDFQSGNEYTVMDIHKGKFGVLICFEVIFPDLVRRFVKNGAEFLVNITNDAWYGKSAASYQHISMVAFRAVENHLPVVRVANTGISGIIEPTGRITKDTDIFVRTYVSGEIDSGSQLKTFYTLYGDIFAYLCLAVTVLLILFFRR
ncbi:MAG: apolipoprotein N-acyltransferase [Nitrospinae bacterium]|nr:apolipoprotein N-acyltransferase [Nitrospinota bacterium]